jgi:hypothetical protein
MGDALVSRDQRSSREPPTPKKRLAEIRSKAKAAMATLGAIVLLATGILTLRDQIFGANEPSPPTSPATPDSDAVAAPSTSASAPRSSPTSSSVFYTGQRTLPNGYYLDLDNPNWAVSASSSAGADIDLGTWSGGYLEKVSGDWGILSSPGASGYAACASFTAFRQGAVPVSALPPGTRLCVRTDQGRVGFLDVQGISGAKNDPIMRFDVTVWNEQ